MPAVGELRVGHHDVPGLALPGAPVMLVVTSVGFVFR